MITRWPLQLQPRLPLRWQLLRFLSEAQRSYINALLCVCNQRVRPRALLPLHHLALRPGGASPARAVMTGFCSSFCRYDPLSFCRAVIFAVGNQILQRAMLSSQVSLRGKSIQEWWAWYVQCSSLHTHVVCFNQLVLSLRIRWYSVNARAKGLSSGAAAPRTLHVGWGEVA